MPFWDTNFGFEDYCPVISNLTLPSFALNDDRDDDDDNDDDNDDDDDDDDDDYDDDYDGYKG